MFEAIRGSTCQRLLRAKPRLSRRSIACAHAACSGPRVLLGRGIGDHFQTLNVSYKYSRPMAKALLFASIP